MSHFAMLLVCDITQDRHLRLHNLHRINVYIFNEPKDSISNPYCGSPVKIIRVHVLQEFPSFHVGFIHIRFATAVDSFPRTLAFQTTSWMVLIKTVIKSSQTRVTSHSNSQCFTRTLSYLFVTG